MAESFFQLNIGVGGDKSAGWQDAGGNKHQEVIIQTQTGAGDPVSIGTGNPMPVSIGAALPAGSNVIGGVSISGVPNVQISGALPAGSNLIGAVQGAVTSGTADSGNPIKIGGVYNSAPITLANGTRGDIQLDANGYLKVNIVAGAAAGGTSSTVGSAVPAVATAVGFSDGTNLRLGLVDGSGNLKVNVAAGAVPALADNQLYTSGSTQGLPAFGVYNDGIGALTSGNAGTFRLTASRQLITTTQANIGGGWSPATLVAANTVNATTVKASAGCLGYIVAYNLNSTPVYVKFYNKASNPSPAADNALLAFVGMVPGNTAGAGFSVPVPAGMQFTTGIAFAIVTGISPTDATSVPATSVVLNYGYN